MKPPVPSFWPKALWDAFRRQKKISSVNMIVNVIHANQGILSDSEISGGFF